MNAAVTFVLTTDPLEFRDRVWGFLESRLECNVIATVLLAVLDGRYDDVQPLFAYRLDERGDVTGAALRTPPLHMMASDLGAQSAAELIDAWLREDPGCSGANAPPATARSLAAAWRARTGGTTTPGLSMAMHALTKVVDPPRPPRGALRAARPDERELMVQWWRAFALEAGSPGADRAQSSVDAKLAARGLMVWDDGGPRSMVCLHPTVAGVTRVGPVYTPPDARRHGYAGMAVAQASRHALARGAHTCMLFTDLANPTSNKIYAEVGYSRCGEWEEYEFASREYSGLR